MISWLTSCCGCCRRFLVSSCLSSRCKKTWAHFGIWHSQQTNFKKRCPPRFFPIARSTEESRRLSVAAIKFSSISCRFVLASVLTSAIFFRVSDLEEGFLSRSFYFQYHFMSIYNILSHLLSNLTFLWRSSHLSAMFGQFGGSMDHNKDLGCQ